MGNNADLQRTVLYPLHQAANAKLVDFGGWEMPLHYGSQLEEHHQVRQHAGMFDVSHMTVVDVTGADARDYLRCLLANDVARLDSIDGKALYSAMLNADGGVIDDLIVYRLGDDYRLVVNCATGAKDLAWMAEHAGSRDVTIAHRSDLAIIAVQGPEAIAKLTAVMTAMNRLSVNDDLSAQTVFSAQLVGGWLLARTGYTGEDGFEVILPTTDAVALWLALYEAGVKPCGLGARDTLRLEAGMNLYGHEMDETISPLAANMGWTIAWESARDFVGRAALEAQRDAPADKLIGLILQERAVLRAGQVVGLNDCADKGVITSGSFSPTLGHSVALARVPVAFAEKKGDCFVEIRGRQVPVTRVKPVFVRQGKPVIEALAV